MCSGRTSRHTKSQCHRRERGLFWLSLVQRNSASYKLTHERMQFPDFQKHSPESPADPGMFSQKSTKKRDGRKKSLARSLFSPQMQIPRTAAVPWSQEDISSFPGTYFGACYGPVASRTGVKGNKCHVHLKNP